MPKIFMSLFLLTISSFGFAAQNSCTEEIWKALDSPSCANKQAPTHLWSVEEFNAEMSNAADDADPEFQIRVFAREWNIGHYTTEKYGCSGDCDFIAIHNLFEIAEASLWPKIKGETYRAPCGSETMCWEPLMAENVKCYVEQTNCGDDIIDPPVFRTFIVECRGDHLCEKPDNCCKVVQTINGKIPELMRECNT